MKAGYHLYPVPHVDEGGVAESEGPQGRLARLESARLPELIDEMERMLNDFSHRPFFGMDMAPLQELVRDTHTTGSFTMAVDIIEDNGSIIVKADLPGLNREQLAVRLIDNILEISGERTEEATIEHSAYLRQERHQGKFVRSLRVPDGLDEDKITTSFTHGVLIIRIPRLDENRIEHTVDIL